MAEEFDTSDSWLLEWLCPLIKGVKQRRQSIERGWLENYKAWQGWPNPRFATPLPDGALRYFIPHARRVVERNVDRIAELAMPNRDWHQVQSYDIASHLNAAGAQSLLKVTYEKKIPTRRNIDALARCLQLYNFACQETSVLIENEEVWGYQQVVDPFSFYIFPETTLDIAQLFVMFEEVIVPYNVYMSFVDKDEKKSIYKKINVEDIYTPEWPYHLVERLAYRGLSTPTDWSLGTSTGNVRRYTEEEFKLELDERRKDVRDSLGVRARTFVALTKVCFRLGSKWFYTVICTNCKSEHEGYIVRLDRKGYTPRYRFTSTRNLPGEAITNSAMDDMRELQYLCNNAISDVEANRAQVQANPIAIDMNAIGRLQDYTFQNRKFWKVPGKPSDVMQSLPIENVLAEGTRSWQIYLALLDKTSGGAIAEGQPGRNMPRAGFVAEDLMNMSLLEQKADCKALSDDILTPGIGDVYAVSMEFMPKKQKIRIPGAKLMDLRTYTKEDIEGTYEFSWLGSLDFQGTQQKADKFNQFAQIILNPQVFPLLLQELQRKGKTVDIENLLTTIYTYALGEQGLGDIIRELSDEEKALLQQQANKPDPKILIEQAKLQQTAQTNQAQMQMSHQKAQADILGQVMKIKGEAQKQEGDRQLKLLDIHQKKLDTMSKLLMSIGASQNGTGKQSSSPDE